MIEHATEDRQLIRNAHSSASSPSTVRVLDLHLHPAAFPAPAQAAAQAAAAPPPADDDDEAPPPSAATLPVAAHPPRPAPDAPPASPFASLLSSVGSDGSAAAWRLLDRAHLRWHAKESAQATMCAVLLLPCSNSFHRFVRATVSFYAVTSWWFAWSERPRHWVACPAST